jgi:extracellular factor (EF) 3-hydroxypalmitic acid methyl ester biosynthesis protein
MGNDMSQSLAGERETCVVFQPSPGLELRATVTRLTRFVVGFEIHDPSIVLRAAETLSPFQILLNGRLAYKGKAVIANFINTGLMTVYEATLEESWMDLEAGKGTLRAQFDEYMSVSRKEYRVAPEFKVVVADMQTFLMEMRSWMDRLEIAVRAGSSIPQGEREVLDEVRESVLQRCFSHFLEFEEVCRNVPQELQPAYSSYVKRQLHPLVLCSPFMYRTYAKPLGYAGDYEMVNMMMRHPYEGGSLYAKILNTFFLHTPPVVAHRNRITYLYGCLVSEAARAERVGKPGRFFNLGCGPAQEIQNFLRGSSLARFTDFTLLDFNEETLRFTEKALGEAKRVAHAITPVKLVRKSVAQVLKDAARSGVGGAQYDCVYCAGLFDYLPDHVCARLMAHFYEILSPGGLLVATNVDSSNTFRSWMDYSVDWRLIYRDRRRMMGIIPEGVGSDACRLQADDTGLNIFLEIRKP